MGKGKPRGLNSARKLRVHRRNKYVIIEMSLRSFDRLVVKRAKCSDIKVKSEVPLDRRISVDKLENEARFVSGGKKCRISHERRVRLWIRL